MHLKKLLAQCVFILVLGSIIGLGANFSLVRKYFQGEFRHAFLSKAQFPSIAFITLVESEELFGKGEALFVDSRSEDAFRDGHILGAINIPFAAHKEKELDFHLLPQEITLVIYCDGSECQSSVGLAKALHRKGFSQIKVFFGGWEEWVKEGLPVSPGNDS